MEQPALFDSLQQGAVRCPQTLRPYQEDAVSALMRAWQTGARAPLLVMATGMGKTTVIAETLRRLLDPARQRALLIAHTEEIIFQLRDRLLNQFAGALDRTYNGAPGIGLVMGDHAEDNARIICATRQSLHARRLPRLLERGVFDLLVIDEAHHVTGANTYAEIVERCRAAHPAMRLFGVTATPTRADGKALGAIFDRVAYEYAMPRAIADGFLTPIVSRVVESGVNLSRLDSASGDYNLAQLERALEDANWLQLALSAFLQHVPQDYPTLAFFPMVSMSRAFVQALCARGIPAAHLDGSTSKPERRLLLERYRAGALRVIANVAVLTEGFDAPHTRCIFIARPTRSSALLTQMVGRGVRLYPGKSHCLVVHLSAADAKLSNVVDLVGRLDVCSRCGAQHMRGVRVCPICGLETQWTARPQNARERGQQHDAEVFDLGDWSTVAEPLQARHVSLFESLQSSWTAVSPVMFTLSLGENGQVRVWFDGVDENGIEHWTCAHYPKGQRAGKTIAVNTDVAALMGQAEAWIEVHFPSVRALTDKTASWRSLDPTPAQIALIRKLTGKMPPEGLTRGRASSLIDTLLNQQRGKRR